MLEGNVIKPSEIIGWFQPLGFTPSDHEASELAYVLNIIRVTKPKEEGFPEQSLLKKVTKALTVISDDLPILIDILQKSIATAGPDIAETDFHRRGSLLVNLNSLLVITHQVRKDRFFIPRGRKKRTAPWNRDVIWLWFLLDGIARKHAKIVSFTKDEGGLGVELIRTALERAEISVTGYAIAQVIRRLKPLPVIDLGPGYVPVPATGAQRPGPRLPTTGKTPKGVNNLGC